MVKKFFEYMTLTAIVLVIFTPLFFAVNEINSSMNLNCAEFSIK